MKKMTAVIVEDSRLARNELKELINEYSQIEIIGEAENVNKAYQLITSTFPQLLFLDINMPRKDGFELLEMLDEIPIVIFTTAYDEYAIKSFEYNAFDYFFIKDGEDCWMVTIKDIVLFEIVGNYTRVYFNDKKPLVYKSLNQIGNKLPNKLFFRTSRQQIINLKAIKKVIPYFKETFKIVLTNDTVIKVSRRQSKLFKEQYGF